MLSSLFRKPQPEPAAFRLPDHQAAIQVEEQAEDSRPNFGPHSRVVLNKADQVAADQYLTCKPLETENAKKAEAAKKALLASLGLASSGVLPDGRIVSKHVVPVPAESKPRAGHNRTSITIQ
jgi:hypothetical protein